MSSEPLTEPTLVLTEGALPDTPDDPYPGLAGVPYLGPTRKGALAAAGLLTLDDLRAATAEQIGGVRGVGLRNGARIKEWLAARDTARAAPVLTPAPIADGASLDLGLAAANQAVQDDMATIERAVTRIQQAIPQGVAHKKFDRQIDKLLSALSELAEGPDTLRPKQLRRALKMLHLIASLLDKFAQVGKLSEKIVVAFAEELRDRRKRLQGILDPKK